MPRVSQGRAVHFRDMLNLRAGPERRMVPSSEIAASVLEKDSSWRRRWSVRACAIGQNIQTDRAHSSSLPELSEMRNDRVLHAMEKAKKSGTRISEHSTRYSMWTLLKPCSKLQEVSREENHKTKDKIKAQYRTGKHRWR